MKPNDTPTMHAPAGASALSMSEREQSMFLPAGKNGTNAILSLNGWAQPHDGLREVLPAHAAHVDYTAHAHIDALWAQLRAMNPSLAVGWSLGGQLVARATLAGIIRPRALVLIAAPWRFVSAPHFPHGMGPSTYALFTQNYATQPARTARRFASLIAQGDAHDARIQAEQAPHLPLMSDAARWLYWLKLLGEWEPDATALHTLPPTLLIHGASDGIVAHAQSEHWQRALPQAELLTLPHAGHAPHLHDGGMVREAIANFATTHLEAAA